MSDFPHQRNPQFAQDPEYQTIMEMVESLFDNKGEKNLYFHAVS
jgi:hypothetical protein